MIDFFVNNQVHIFFTCGLVCILLCLFTMVIKFHYVNKKKALAKVELGTAAIMIADAIAHMYYEESSMTGWWMVRISAFVMSFLALANVIFLNEYVIASYMSTGKFKKLPVRLRLGFMMPTIGFVLLVIFSFTGLYYYFDDANRYYAGPLLPLELLLPIISVGVIASFAIQYRRFVKGGLAWAVLTFSILPVFAGIVQIFLPEASLINLSAWLAALTLFFVALIDQNNELSRAANTEAGTGLPNAYGFLYEVDQIIHYHDITNYCGYYFDIVRMNQINNKYGRKNGDEIICKFARVVHSRMDKDEVLGRLGGNYFVALVKKDNTEKFLSLLSDVPVEIEFEEYHTLIHMAAVAGVYEIRKKNVVASEIIGNCANALSYAKNTVHKPYVFHDDELEKELYRIQRIEELARKGLNRNEFVAFYQPKIDSETHMLCGAEALARWRHDGKLVPPMEFVPIMEHNGSVCDLDFYILRRVCEDICGWLEQGITPVPVSVNFSRKNLGNPILAEAISNVVESYHVPKELIQIEVTETLDEFPMSYLTGVVEALRRYGISTAIDDFGTGSSSIKILKEVHFDVLKIDKTFVDFKDEKEKRLLKDIIRMSKDIGLQVIAEGVETKEQVAVLNEMGCMMIQGYVYDKPLEKAEYDKKLANRYYA